MRTLNQWLDEYQESHQNRTNKQIHNVCVPLIMFSLLGILHSLTPIKFNGIDIHYDYILLAIALIFYISISLKYTLYMLIFCAVQLLIIFKLENIDYVFNIYLGIFIVSWIGQFIGHKIEGKKPSFFKDLQFLLVGPLWVLKNFKL